MGFIEECLVIRRGLESLLQLVGILFLQDMIYYYRTLKNKFSNISFFSLHTG